MASTLFNKYIWLADTIYSAGRISRRDIDSKWSTCYLNDNHESAIPRRTFLNWRNSIEELFGLIIDCDRTTNCYYIANRDELSGSITQQWLLNTFSVTNLIHESRDIQQCIVLEPMPSDAVHLSPILDAIRLGRKVCMTYRKFRDEEGHTFLAAPYCLKTFKQRWYVVCCPDDHPDQRRVYALDRILSLQPTDQPYSIPDDFDAEVFFRDCYGIWHDDGQPAEDVVIRVDAYEAKFLRSLPLHHSQQELSSRDLRDLSSTLISQSSEFVYFRYRLSPTFDFIQELRTYGHRLTVLAPQWLAQRLADDAAQVVANYQGC